MASVRGGRAGGRWAGSLCGGVGLGAPGQGCVEAMEGPAWQLGGEGPAWRAGGE